MRDERLAKIAENQVKARLAMAYGRSVPSIPQDYQFLYGTPKMNHGDAETVKARMRETVANFGKNKSA